MTATEVDYKQALDLRRAVTEDVPYGRNPVKIRCPYHDDKVASGCVYPDGFHCAACGMNVGPLKFLATHNGLDIHTQAAQVRAEADRLIALGPPEEKKTDQAAIVGLAERVEAWQGDPPDRRKWGYWLERGFNAHTILTAHLAHTGRAYVLPLYDAEGQLFSVKYRRDDALDPHAPKYWTHPGTGRTAVYYPPVRDWATHKGPVVLAEGELDALLLAQHGVPAISVNNGVNAIAAILPSILERHGGVVLCLDNDEPGRHVTDELRLAYIDTAIPVVWRDAWGKDVGECFHNIYGDKLLDRLRDAYRMVQMNLTDIHIHGKG